MFVLSGNPVTCFINKKERKNRLHKEYWCPPFLLLACRETECCHSVSGESVHFREEVHHVDNISSICASNGKGVLIFGSERVTKLVIFYWK